MKRTLFLATAAAAMLSLSASSAPQPSPAAPARRPTISIADLIERTDRAAILRSLKILGVIKCREGHRTRTVLWVQNIWPYGYVESTPERGDQWCTIKGFETMFHAGGCPDRETTTYGGAAHTAMSLRRASTYTWAPLPSWLALGDDRRKNNWAFPDPERNHSRLALAHDSGFLDPGWTDSELARIQQPVKSDPDAFLRCYKSADHQLCFGRWGPKDGSFVRSGWQMDRSRRSRLLAMLFSAQLAREGPQGYRPSFQRHTSATGRGHTYYHLVPRETGPETGTGWIQVIYPKREDAMPIGSPKVFEEKKDAPDAMGAILYGTFRRPARPGARCDSVRLMPPKKASQ